MYIDKISNTCDLQVSLDWLLHSHRSLKPNTSGVINEAIPAMLNIFQSILD